MSFIETLELIKKTRQIRKLIDFTKLQFLVFIVFFDIILLLKYSIVLVLSKSVGIVSFSLPSVFALLKPDISNDSTEIDERYHPFFICDDDVAQFSLRFFYSFIKFFKERVFLVYFEEAVKIIVVDRIVLHHGAVYRRVKVYFNESVYKLKTEIVLFNWTPYDQGGRIVNRGYDRVRFQKS